VATHKAECKGKQESVFSKAGFDEALHSSRLQSRTIESHKDAFDAIKEKVMNSQESAWLHLRQEQLTSQGVQNHFAVTGYPELPNITACAITMAGHVFLIFDVSTKGVYNSMSAANPKGVKSLYRRYPMVGCTAICQADAKMSPPKLDFPNVNLLVNALKTEDYPQIDWKTGKTAGFKRIVATVK
jgi:hypothetical protein